MTPTSADIETVLRHLRIHQGEPTMEELAALVTAVLVYIKSSRITVRPPAPRPFIPAQRSRWSSPARSLGVSQVSASGWQDSSLPQARR